MKRINLINGYVIDEDNQNMILRSNVQIKTNEEGEKIESYNTHGYFQEYKSLFVKLHKLLKLDKLKDNNELNDLKLAIYESNREIRDLSDRIEGIK